MGGTATVGDLVGRAVRSLVSRERRSEHGAVLALVAVGAIALLGAVGLAVDGSRMLEERRHAQAAADHAAVAAAYNRCTVTGSDAATARAAGRAAATVNGFDDASPRAIVNVDPVGDVATTYDYRAVVTSTIDGTFSRVLGFSTFDVSAEATSSGSGCGAAGGGAVPGAIYAGGICPVSGKYGVDISGSVSQVYGGIHTNDDANVGGSGNIFFENPNPPDDPFTYVGSINAAATANNSFQAGYPQDVGPSVPSPQWPTGWAPSTITGSASGVPAFGTWLRPYYELALAQGHYSTGKITSVDGPGVWYSTATDVAIDASLSAAGSSIPIVLIAPQGKIIIAVSSKTVTPYTHASLPTNGLIMMANAPRAADKTCEDPTISLSGSNVNWNGVVWGASGQVELNGSTNVAVNGSIVAHSVKMNGSNLVIRYNSSLFPASSDPTIILLK